MFARKKIDGIKKNAKNPLQCKQIGRCIHPRPVTIPYLLSFQNPCMLPTNRRLSHIKETNCRRPRLQLIADYLTSKKQTTAGREVHFKELSLSLAVPGRSGLG